MHLRTGLALWLKPTADSSLHLENHRLHHGLFLRVFDQPVALYVACGQRNGLDCAVEPASVGKVDVDPVALAYARANLPGAEVHAGDLWSALPARLAGRVDVVAANAPYVPTDALATMPAEARDHEPHAALDGGRDGLRLHRRVAAGAPRWLAPGGVLVLETSRPQAEATLAAVAAAGLRARVVTDDATDGTAVVGRLPDERGEPVEELGLRGDDELAGPRERQPRDAVELGEDGAAP